MKRNFFPALLACSLACGGALAQPDNRSGNDASVSVQAGPLRGSAAAGPSSRSSDRAAAPQRERCDRVTVRSGDGSSSASASVTTGSSGTTALAGGGSPNARTEFSDCDDTRQASTRRGDRNDRNETIP
jgi:hypothetical protein